MASLSFPGLVYHHFHSQHTSEVASIEHPPSARGHVFELPHGGSLLPHA